MKGYTLLREQSINEINSVAQIFEHNKTKAQVLYIKNDDSNKVFSIGFKTPPKDSTGIMHILEHSVLCGSKKFPSKEPFVELAKGSLNTFLNAMTFPDKTLYPIASQNNKDFHNLMEVYLDAVFYPNIYDNKEILMQEGWHYDLEKVEDGLTYKGVVYNEMKGAFSSPEGVLMRKIQETLFPDTIYSNESGGDPKYIPDLTQDYFIETHQKYYHPSNSYIFLYGDLDIEKSLEFIDNDYLSNFEYKEVEDEIKEQKAYDLMKDFSYSYSISEDEEEDEKTFIALNYVTGKSTDDEVYIDLSLLEYVLLGAQGAPLKKALIDAEICKDVFGSFDNGILQPIFSIIIKNSDEKHKEKFKEVVNSTLKDLIKNGIDKKLIEGCINTFEFKLREADTGGYPKGIIYSMNSLDTWLYGGDPLQYIGYESHIENVKKALTTNHFENLIQKYLLDNTHSSCLVLKPEKGLSKKEDENLKVKLKNFRDSLDEKEVQNIIDETQSLLKRQTTPDTKENLEKIPLLSLDDIDKEVVDLKIEEIKIEDTLVLKHDQFTSDICYLNYMFDSKCVAEEDLMYFSLMTNLLAKVDTKNYEYKELSNEILINTGELSFKNQVYGEEQDIEIVKPYLEIHTKVMNEKIDKSTHLICEIIENTLFEDNKRMRELVRELISRYEMMFMQSGHQIALARVSSYFSSIASYGEKTGGYNYYKFLKDLDVNFEEKSDSLKEKLYKVKELVFNKKNFMVSITGQEKEISSLESSLKDIIDVLGTEDIKKQDYSFEEVRKNEGLMIPANVQYVAKGFNFRKLGYDYNGSMLVLKTILGYEYLWNRVRVQGGAYGCMTSISRSGNCSFVSYRDPNLSQTLNAYDECYKFVRDFEVDDREMTKYIIGTISNLDTPLSPSSKGAVATALYMRKISLEDLQRERNEVLSTTYEKIREFYKVIESVMNKDFLTVVGDENKIKEEQNIFNTIINMMK
ncbi:MAG: insulinase family protein [Peptostreptococcaceae bacterium]